MRVATRDRLTSARLWLPALRELEARAPELVPSVCDEADVEPAAFEALRGRIPLPSALRFLRAATVATREPLFALRAGRRYERETFDLFMRALIAQPTADAAMQSARRFASLPIEGLEITYLPEGSQQRVVFTVDGSRIEDPMLAEYLIGLVGCITAQLGGPRLRILDVELVHAPRAPKGAYREAIGAGVVFGASRCSFALPDIDLELPDADPVLASLLAEQAQAMLEAQPRTRTHRGRVEAYLGPRLGLDVIGLPGVAAGLRMSERTLKRRLAEEGTSFGELVDELRRTRSLELVGDAALSLGEIGLAVGFTSAGAFRRAFTRWTGKSPRRYRAERGAV